MPIKVLKLSRLVKTIQFTVKTMQFTVKTSNFAKLNLGKLYYFLFWFLKKKRRPCFKMVENIAGTATWPRKVLLSFP